MRKLFATSMGAAAAAALLGLAPGVVTGAGTAAQVVNPPRVKAFSDATSTNWSGYAVTGRMFGSVSGSWTQPTADCSTSFPARGKAAGGNKSPNTAAGFWVGLDGFDSFTVEQIGTAADCSHGTPVYYAWYELYPAAMQLIPEVVQPGDAMTATVDADAGTLTITDGTQGWTFTKSGVDFSGFQRSSAEWIAEAPSHGRILDLTDFGTVTFTSASADGKAIGTYPDPVAVTMVTRKGEVRAATSKLSGGDSFSITWKHG